MENNNSIVIDKIVKRNGKIVDFNKNKITEAVYKAMLQVNNGDLTAANKITRQVIKHLVTFIKKETVSVELVQDIVEAKLMSSKYKDVAKAYILYRDEQARLRKPDIFRPRTELKPYEYPHLYDYVNAIRHSYWLHTEFNFTSDIQDFKVNLLPSERKAIKNAMLAISQIEVAVKSFWGRINFKFPKPEIGAVGITFGESEVRHHDAYSHLLEILGLNDEFKNLKDVPAIQSRIEYLNKALKNSASYDNKDYTLALLLFSLFIEHVSLFSQFLVIMSFNKHKNLFKGISNVVEATSKEEQIHGDFGIDIIKIIKEENPEWFDDKFEEIVKTMCIASCNAEMNIIDWIYEDGDLEFMPKSVVKNFIKDRFNQSLNSIQMKNIFEVDEKMLEETEWFDDEILGTKHGDFFVKRSINYTKKSQSITENDLFDE